MKPKRRDEYENIDYSDASKRLNRVIGQMEGVRKMLDDQRKLGDVLMQCKAVHSALKSVENNLLKAHLEAALESASKMQKKKDRQEKIKELELLFKRID